MRRRTPLVPMVEGVPARLCRFVRAEWDTMPGTPTDEFAERYEAQCGTKGSLGQEWERWRYLMARQAFGRAQRAWCEERGIGWRQFFQAIREQQ